MGGRLIKLPAPEGFERIDGLDPELDRQVESLLGASNKYLARFEPLKSNTADAGRSFNVQMMRKLESMEIGERTFADVKQQMKGEMDRMQETVRQEIDKQISAVEKQRREAGGEDLALSISDVNVLGYFDDSPSSFGFTMAMKVAAKGGGKAVDDKVVTAGVVVPVNGRLLYLYSIADFHSPADRQWVEKAAGAWRDAVVAVNPRLAGPSGKREFDFNSVGRSGIVGGIIGGVVALFALLFKKKKPQGS